jgi:hypothetical protein
MGSHNRPDRFDTILDAEGNEVVQSGALSAESH